MKVRRPDRKENPLSLYQPWFNPILAALSHGTGKQRKSL